MGSSASQDSSKSYEKPESTVIDLYPPKSARSTDLVQTKDSTQRSRKEEIYLLKHMFYKLDPAVIKDGNDANYGQLKLAVKYISAQELLLVKVFEARYLTAKNVRGHIVNPYVKIELVSTKVGDGDNDNALVSDENVAKYTSPVGNLGELAFNEIFSFRIVQENFEDLKLRCSVWSSDGLDHDEFFGEIYIDIAELDCIDVVQTVWHDLKAQADITIGGEINLHLGYKLPQTLTVTINHARGIKKVSNDARSALSVRAVIPGVPYVFRTTPVRGDREYTWIETFSFPIPKEELSSRYLVLVVADANEDESYLGECHIELDKLDTVRGYEGSFRLADMRGNSVVRSRWNRNAVTQELQEALHAHSVYMRPQFLFDPASSKTKALSVSVPKAFVHSQMRVVNGVVVQ